jgi:hypothetical protein
LPSSSKRKSVQFIGAPDLAEFLAGLAKQHPDNIEIGSSREDKDAARLGMDLNLYWHILAYVAEGYSVAHMSVDLARYLRGSKHNEIVVKTPAREVKIKVPADATPEETERNVKAKLDELYRD